MADLSQIRVSGTLYDIKDAVARQATGAPAVAATVSDMTDRNKVYVYTGSESGYTSGNWYYFNGSSWVSGGVYNSAAVETDTSLSVSGAPADAKVTGDSIKYIVSVGDTAPSQHTQLLFSESTTELDLVTTETFNSEISDLKSQITNLESIPYAVKQAMDNLFAKAGYADNDASGDYAIFHAWASTLSVVSISAVFTQGNNDIYLNTPLNDLKQYLVVTATYDNQSTATITNYTLSGTLTAGTSTVTVTYEGKTTTFTCTVTDAEIVTVDWANPGGVTSNTLYSYDSTTGGLRVYRTASTATYQQIRYALPMIDGYTYMLSFHAERTLGVIGGCFENSNGGIYSGTGQGWTTTSGDYQSELAMIPDGITDTSVLLCFFCTGATKEKGDITYSNIKLIKAPTAQGE